MQNAYMGKQVIIITTPPKVPNWRSFVPSLTTGLANQLTSQVTSLTTQQVYSRVQHCTVNVVPLL